MNRATGMFRQLRPTAAVRMFVCVISVVALSTACSGKDSASGSTTTAKSKSTATTSAKSKATSTTTAASSEKNAGAAAPAGALKAENDDEKLLLEAADRAAADPCAALDLDQAAVTAVASKGKVRPQVVSTFFTAISQAVAKLDLPDVAAQKALVVAAYEGIAQGVIGKAAMPDLGPAFQKVNAELAASAKKSCDG